MPSLVNTETALWLLRSDEVLGDLMDGNGMTCLQVLSKMPSAFKSGYQMGKLKTLVYHCKSSKAN